MGVNGLEATAEAIEAFLKASADHTWKDLEQPYLLSMAATDMKDGGIDYRLVLGDEKLKAFVKRTEKAGGYRLVEHPTQKAKVGLVPGDAEFSFPSPHVARVGIKADVQIPEHNAAPSSEQWRVVVTFLHALSCLSDEEINSVVIPTRVLVKLLGKR